MMFLLCGFGSFLVVQLIKIIWFPLGLLSKNLKTFLVLVASFGISAALSWHHVVELVVYALAGAGLAVLIHRVARLAHVAGDLVIQKIMRK